MKKGLVSIIALGVFIFSGCTSMSSEKELTNSEKAVQVLESLGSGDPAAFETWVSEDSYTQHNLTFPDGRQTVLDALPTLKEAGTTVEIQRVFSDGEYVALQTKYNLFGEKAGFDIFRFENGVVVEHWDNLTKITIPNPSGHTQFDGVTEIEDRELTEENRTLVKNFVKDILMGKNPENLTSYFNGDNYIQHNSGIADGLSGLGAALKAMAEAGLTMVYDQTHLTIAEGNFVLVVSEGSFAGEHSSFYDLFRVENGYIAEHWDIIETIIPESERANTNGKF
jgi:predicted SnoaL-like aldol condensation-catalyzing enzyme